MKNLKFCLYLSLALGSLFSVLSVSFHGDVSLLAFPVSVGFTALYFYFVHIRFLKKNSIEKIESVRRIFQYEPFAYITAFVLQRSGKNGMPFALDLVMALIWVAILVLSIVVLYYLSEKRVCTLSADWAKERKAHPLQKKTGVAKIRQDAIEWIDAIVQAVFTIVLLNIFFLQLYAIPSESMVPTFLVKDRVIVFKTLAGPKFPLSDVGLPYLQKYNRGDIVVFRNPHYKNDRKSEVKSFFSQFVYMLTFSLLNTNTDENGELKSDPLVKRIVGEPGEQLMLMDGTLYARTKNDGEFKPVKQDAGWAAWDLNTLPSATKNKIQWIPQSTSQVEGTAYIEAERRNLNLVNAALECENLTRRFSQYFQGASASFSDIQNLYSESELFVYNLFNNIDSMTLTLLGCDGGLVWFDHFMNDWHRALGDTSLISKYTEDGRLTGENLVGGDLYTDSNFRLNVMTKLLFARILVRNAELLSKNASAAEISSDSVRRENFEKAQLLADYLLHLDQRNMPIFPPNGVEGRAQYIPENCFMMMGDNRYNSLDMRHSYEQHFQRLFEHEELSVRYYSNMDPQFVSRDRILGKASFRFWPLDRIGKPGVGRGR